MTIETTKKYQWNPHFSNPIAHTDINKVVAELEAIQEMRGEISPALVLESSKNKKSVLHSYFQWDNEEAANSWRLHQARVLLRRIEVTVIKDGEPVSIRVYETTNRASNSDGFGYKKFDAIVDSDLVFIKKRLIEDLNRVKVRIIQHSFNKKALSFIDSAIEELNKDSTETKEVINTDLSAVA